ncbi:hypothetical protein FRC04_005748 [Tulasnella sp. 424]|nr:hypothetical protein FRC04_005748 [Tulasnella sp. 424]KAG8977536.1 hypothetical protein FRC05_001394 [Tulasnella sp. 425]
MCKDLPLFLNSTTDIQQQLDSLLVVQLVGKHLASDEGRGAIIRHFQSGSAKSFAGDLESPLRALFTLQPAERISSPPLPLQSNLLNATPKAALDHLFSTIQNNHFSVLSLYLHPIAHAIFPLASRAFNHSCLPNATASYRYENGSVWQDIRALRDIEANEEITISYIDPASPLSSRQAALRRTYGFECTCGRCDMKVSIPSQHALPPQHELAKPKTALCEWVFSDHPPALSSVAASLLPVTNLTVKDVHPALLDLMNDYYLPALSSRFSDLAHSPNPRSDSAVATGLTLLAMYFVIYPRYHPLIGLHCLELAKVVWNVGIISPAEEASCQSMASKLLDLARSIMQVSLPSNGIEGEDGSSPWKELQTMETLLGGDVKD